GGGQSFPSCVAWVADDFVGDAPLEPYLIASGDSGPAVNEGGDFLTSRPAYPFTNTWIGTCYTFEGGSGTQNVHPRRVWFGRQRDQPTTPTVPTSPTSRPT